jgi:hypothetical protein
MQFDSHPTTPAGSLVRRRMPTFFGAAFGPRLGPNGRTYECDGNPTSRKVRVECAADQTALAPLLTDGFSVREPAAVRFDFQFFSNVEWLAGRGYNTVGVSIPVVYAGTVDTVEGWLMLALWENLADAIITGREELGFAKLFAEIPPPRELASTVACHAHWDGFTFLSVRVSDMEAVSPVVNASTDLEGLLHHKYFPRTGEIGAADVDCVTYTPPDWPNLTTVARWTGVGRVTMNECTWVDLPTLMPIVNALAPLAGGEVRVAEVSDLVGGKDLSDMRVLH